MKYKPEVDLNHQFVSEEHRSGCIKSPRPRYKTPAYMVQDGWNEDGTRRMIQHKTHWLPMNCGHSYSATDPSCRGCRWRSV